MDKGMSKQFEINPILNSDSYKFGHINFYPEGVSEVYSNLTPRSVKHLNVPEKYKDDTIVWVGGQASVIELVELWDKYFFNLSDDELEETLTDFSRVIAPFAGANYSVKHLRDLHKVGYLPLKIKTLDEGIRVPVGIPVMTIRNTLPEFYWLTNFVESCLSAETWVMPTSATIASYYKQILGNWAEKTGGDRGFVDFQAHDFSYRGMGGTMDAIKSGTGHLLSFKGSDTVPAIPFIEYYYSGKETFIAASVPATEHSIQTAFQENDKAYIKSMLDRVPTGIVSVVVDGYDYWNVLENIVPELKDEIMARQPDAMGFNKTVLRPDSGDPVKIITGYTSKEFKSTELALEYCIEAEFDYELEEFELYEIEGMFYKFDVSYWEDGSPKGYGLEKIDITKAEVKGSVQVLWDIFGGTTNNKGYKTLDQHIGLIYGDSITLERAEQIMSRLEAKGFASDNVVLGVGSYSYQYNTRDTLGFAVKATNIVINGEDIALFKDPKTDDGTKKSAKGLLKVAKQGNQYILIDQVSREKEDTGELTTLFEDGKFLKTEKFAEMRERLERF